MEDAGEVRSGTPLWAVWGRDHRPGRASRKRLHNFLDPITLGEFAGGVLLSDAAGPFAEVSPFPGTTFNMFGCVAPDVGR